MDDIAHYRAVWTIDKFMPQTSYEAELIEILSRENKFPVKKLIEMFPSQYQGQDRYEGNCLLNTGINSIAWPLIIGGGGTALSQANSYIGVGTSATGALASQTGLLANAVFVAVTSTSGPTSQAVSWVTTFGASSANQAWNEICVANNNTNASGTVLNRLVQVMGTKASPAVWIVTLTITLA
jgi:hypothetical protein